MTLYGFSGLLENFTPWTLLLHHTGSFICKKNVQIIRQFKLNFKNQFIGKSSKCVSGIFRGLLSLSLRHPIANINLLLISMESSIVLVCVPDKTGKQRASGKLNKWASLILKFLLTYRSRKNLDCSAKQSTINNQALHREEKCVDYLIRWGFEQLLLSLWHQPSVDFVTSCLKIEYDWFYGGSHMLSKK